MRRIMVIGASTSLGTALITALLADERVGCVFGVGHKIESPLVQAPHSFVYECVDLKRQRSIRTMLFGRARELEIDTIVDFAVHQDASLAGSELHAQNVEATRTILQLAERQPTIRRFILRSHGEAYDLRSDLPTVMTEEHPLNLSPHNPQWLRDRIEADLTVCARMGMSPLTIAVLRCAECLSAGVGSPLYDLLVSRIRLRPLGFDPMMNVLSVEDLVAAHKLAIFSEKQGVFNIPGADTLPLSEIFEKWGKEAIALPSPLLKPAYALRDLWLRGEFDYRSNRRRFHFGGVLDGHRAREDLGYIPSHPLSWTHDHR
jgi:UDP-glucose 4-epimerase